MYAVGLRHPRDADGAAYVNGFARAGALTGIPVRTGSSRSGRFGSCARAGAFVDLDGSAAGT